MEKLSIAQKKSSIVDNIDYLTDEQVNFIFDLSNLPTFCNKNDLFKLASKDDDYTRKVDSATPIDYYRRIEEIYPNFKKGNMVYDYNVMTFGEMLNINDLIVDRIMSLKK